MKLLTKNDPSEAKILICLGTRPELIKFAPLIRCLRHHGLSLTVVNTGQHTSLLDPLFDLFDIQPDITLDVMQPGQSLNALGARLQQALDPVLEARQPDLVLVQGDTASALNGALAAFNRKVAVGHLEAGLRSGNPFSPFPEEMNRRLISQLATTHFAATPSNRHTLLDEGVSPDAVHCVGNTVIDALLQTLATTTPSDDLQDLLDWSGNRRLILVTTHRRENFGETMTHHLQALREFIQSQPDLCMVFPVHPNPNVRTAVEASLSSHPRIRLTSPLGYRDFVHLLRSTWLIVSDSGGIQEEATALGRPMIVLRENTERPEAVECGVARLVGESPARLREMLQTALTDANWFQQAQTARTVFGDGQTSERIVNLLLGRDGLTTTPKQEAA